MYVNPKIFKAYDIRGEFPEQINAKSVYIIARAFVEFLRGKDPKPTIHPLSIVVAQDARPSSPELKKAVIEALLDEGVHIIDIGSATTPFHGFVVIQTEADGGIMITASHTPARMNGLKFLRKGGDPLGQGMGLEVVQQIAQRSIFQQKNDDGRGGVEQKTFYREYIDFLLERVDLSKTTELTVVIDAAGGMSAVLLPYLVKRLPFKTIVLNGDAFFYSGVEMMDPSKEVNLATLKNEVLKERADFGIAFDQDGDRSGFVTKNARFLRADYVGAFFARELLKSHAGASIVYDVRSSSIVRETVLKGGGNAIESRVGHSFIKAKMREMDALFSAEMSGHFYFKDFWYLDSDFLPLLYFAQFLAALGKTSDQVLEEFQVYPASGEINFTVDEGKDHLLEQIAAHFHDAHAVKWVDGLSIYYDEWWTNIRMSNTEPLVRLNVEAENQELLDEKINELRKLIEG
ncbi:MAG: phosphomannomutase/phosphoglucomutase [Patescibacteria group bacterium]